MKEIIIFPDLQSNDYVVLGCIFIETEKYVKIVIFRCLHFAHDQLYYMHRAKRSNHAGIV